eukprot:10635860-Ditylum_brightwellii.AAC.1
MCPNELRKDMLTSVMLELLINKHNMWADLIYGSADIITKVILVVGLVELEEREGKPGISGEMEVQIQLTNRQTGNTVTLTRREPSDAIQQLGLENDLLGEQKTDYKKRHSTR